MRNGPALNREDTRDRDVGHARFAEDVVFALHVVQPPADAEERLVAGEVLLCFGDVDEADRLEELGAIRLALQFPAAT